MYSYCSDICKKSTNLYNRANYILRQYATAIRDFENLKPLTANQMEIYKNVRSTTDNTKHEPKNKWLTYGILDFYLKHEGHQLLQYVFAVKSADIEAVA